MKNEIRVSVDNDFRKDKSEKELLLEESYKYPVGFVFTHRYAHHHHANHHRCPGRWLSVRRERDEDQARGGAAHRRIAQPARHGDGCNLFLLSEQQAEKGGGKMKNDGGPAHPVTPFNAAGQTADTFVGMSLRDYFAAKVLTGLVLYEYGASLHREFDADNRLADKGSDKESPQSYFSRIAYDLADAMLAERDKDEK